MPAPDGPQQTVGVVEEGDVADEEHRGSRAARHRQPDGRGHDAVDAVGAPVGVDLHGARRLDVPLEVSDRHGGGHDQLAIGRQGRDHLTCDQRLGDLGLVIQGRVDRRLRGLPELLPTGHPRAAVDRLHLRELARPRVQQRLRSQGQHDGRRPVRVDPRALTCDHDLGRARGGEPLPRHPRRQGQLRGARSPPGGGRARCATAHRRPGSPRGRPHTVGLRRGEHGPPEGLRHAADRRPGSGAGARHDQPAPAGEVGDDVDGRHRGGGRRWAPRPRAVGAPPGREGTWRPHERLAEGQVEVDGTRARPGRLGVGPSGHGSPTGRGRVVGDARGVEPADGPSVEVRLVDGLRSADIEQLGRPVRGAARASGTRARSASTTDGCSSTAAVPLVVSTTVGSPVPRARPSARKPALRSSWWTCTSMPSQEANAKAIGVERDPGQTTACSTPSRTHSSTSVAQKVA